MHGGDQVAAFLKAQGTPFVFTLVGGHISPILVGCKQRGIRVVDTRHEATAVFAADAVARLTGRPGVAAVTAGPGVTNSVTALKNAQMAQSPVLLIGGAAPTALQGRGALQDIDQMSLMRPVVKWARRVRRVAEIVPVLAEAFTQAQTGVPGPVFVEIPIDLLYPEEVVRKWYGADRGGKSLADRALKFYLHRHAARLFAGDWQQAQIAPLPPFAPPEPDEATLRAALQALEAAARPLLLVGSQAVLDAPNVAQLAAALNRIGAPVYLSGMARGLLGPGNPLQMRHKRREALREADVVLLAGVPLDFRLDYGNQIRRSATYIAANRSKEELRRNRRPTLALHGDPALCLRRLADLLPVKERWGEWRGALRGRDEARNVEIRTQALEPAGGVNPLHLCLEIDAALTPHTILVADGGDFVATAAYTVRPRAPLTWLDPGPFGTLGVGAGFALGAKLVHPEADVWLLFGDGSVGYSLSEFDTYTRHGINVLAVVGNDAAWSQIARDQIDLLGDDVATVLAHSDYHLVARSLGGAGLAVDDPELVEERLREARVWVQEGQPVLVNARLGKSDFRKGSVSM